MTGSAAQAGRQMYLAIVSFSGVCLDPCEHDDCARLLATAARWRELDPQVDQLAVPHPRFDEEAPLDQRDIAPLRDEL